MKTDTRVIYELSAIIGHLTASMEHATIWLDVRPEKEKKQLQDAIDKANKDYKITLET